jgi:hypothetical protein
MQVSVGRERILSFPDFSWVTPMVHGWIESLKAPEPVDVVFITSEYRQALPPDELKKLEAFEAALTQAAIQIVNNDFK